MEKVRNSLKWVYKNLVFIGVAMFMVIYLRWFQLLDIGNFIIGLLYFFVPFVGSAFFTSIPAKNKYLQILLLFPYAVFLTLNIWYIKIAFPVVLDTTIANQSIYFLTYSEEPDEKVYYDYSVVKWKWGVIPETFHMPRIYRIKKFQYDKAMQVLNVVGVSDGREVLIFSEGKENSRYYDLGDQYRDYFYYPSSVCISFADNKHPCEILEYEIYQCELDNTACVPIPFRYIGRGGFTYMRFNESTNEIDFYIWPDDSDEFLVYSYSDHPRCYVEGCEILNAP